MSQCTASASALEEEAPGYWQDRAEGRWSWPGTEGQGQRLAKFRVQKGAWQKAAQAVLLELCGPGQVTVAVKAPVSIAMES